MGTNYYVAKEQNAPEFSTETEQYYIHIGKKSFGWEFSFRSYKQHEFKEIYSYKDWKKHINYIGVVYNEYGEPLTPKEFYSIVRRSRKLFTRNISEELITPLNHIDYCIEHNTNEIYAEHLTHCFKDADGFAFQCIEFF